MAKTKTPKKKPARRGPGQPPLPPNRKRVDLKVRLSPDERAICESFAKAAGLPLTVYLRLRGLRKL